MSGLRRLRGRWTTSDRSPSAEDRRALQARLAEGRPRCWASIVVDAEFAARYRGDHHQFRNSLDALVQVVRLCVVTEAFFAQVCHRLSVALADRGVWVLPHLIDRLAVATGQVNIGRYAVIEPGVYFPHGQVVIDGLTRVERGAVVRPFVTLGLVDGNVLGPTVGANARIGTGARLIGPITVGARAQIGANAVVLDDVPDDAVAVGVPARVVGSAAGTDR